MSSGILTTFGAEVFSADVPQVDLTLFGIESLSYDQPEGYVTYFNIEAFETGLFFDNSAKSCSLFLQAPPDNYMPLYIFGGCGVGTGYELVSTGIVFSDNFSATGLLNYRAADGYLGGAKTTWGGAPGYTSVSGFAYNLYGISSGNYIITYPSAVLPLDNYVIKTDIRLGTSFLNLTQGPTTYPTYTLPFFSIVAKANALHYRLGSSSNGIQSGFELGFTTLLEPNSNKVHFQSYGLYAENSQNVYQVTGKTYHFTLENMVANLSGTIQATISGENMYGYFNDDLCLIFNNGNAVDISISGASPMPSMNDTMFSGVGFLSLPYRAAWSGDWKVDNFRMYGAVNSNPYPVAINCYNNSIPLYTTASEVVNPSDSGIPLYTIASANGESGFPLYTFGIGPGESGFPLYIGGYATSESGISLYIGASESSVSGIPLYISGMTIGENDIPLYIYGLDYSSGQIPLYMSGAAFSQNGINLYVGALGDRSDNSMPLYLYNSAAYSGMPLVTWGRPLTGVSNPGNGWFTSEGRINLFIEGQGSYGEMALYINAPTGNVVNGVDLYINSNNTVNSGLTLYMPSYATKNGPFKMYTHGF